MSANLPMGGQIITGHGTPIVSTDVPNKAYVDALVASFFSTGDFKTTLKIVADTGWVLCDDGTIGSATSGASTRANADTQNLFNLLFNNTVDGYAPILTSGGGATTRAAQVSASAAWAANCRMSLTRMLGRALGFASGGAGLTVRGLGQFIGEENHQLVMGELPASPAPVTATTGAYNPTVVGGAAAVAVANGSATVGIAGGGTGNVFLSTAFALLNGFASLVVGSNTANLGSGTGHNTMQPTVFLNVMIKL
jgi:hypothetical protein